MDAKQLAEKTGDAYSAGSFEEGEWEKAASMLLAMEYTPEQAEGILRSKWTRWCRDAYSDDGMGTSSHLRAFLTDPKNNCTIDDVNSLIC